MLVLIHLLLKVFKEQIKKVKQKMFKNSIKHVIKLNTSIIDMTALIIVYHAQEFATSAPKVKANRCRDTSRTRYSFHCTYE